MNRFLAVLVLAVSVLAACGDDEEKNDAVTCEQICDAGAACQTTGADEWKSQCLAECGFVAEACPAAADQDCLACMGECSADCASTACACPDTGNEELTCNEVCTALVACSGGDVDMAGCMADCAPVESCIATKTDTCRPCLSACDRTCVESTCGTCNAG